jgi:hypothetical protein
VEVGNLRSQLSRSQGSARGLREEIEKVGRETGLVGRALREEVRARRRLANEQSKIRVETRKARLESEENFETARRTLGLTRQQARAERQVTQTVDRRNVAERRAVVARERASELTAEEFRRTQAVTTVDKERLRAQEALERTQRRRTDSTIRGLTTEQRIQSQLSRLEQNRAVQRGIQDLGFDPRTGQRITTATRALSRFKDVLGDANNRANRVSFTFRRLFGILAAFAVARAAIQGFNRIVRSLVTLNAEVEQAELGIASLFSAVGEIRDPFGSTVDSAQQLVLAQQEARRQTLLLRQDALRTTATFRTLLETFQTAIAPGLAAGLGIDEVRAFTIQIAQAASAIGLQQNQLAEEIRSILSGTIQARTTRIAVALGITNEDIRNAREAGELAQFLEDRFVAFNEAGRASFNTFNGLVARIQDGFQLLLTTGGVEFFDEIKNAARDLFEVLVQVDGLTGAITPDPRAVQVVQAISSGLQQGVAAARQIAQSLNFGTALSAARALGASLTRTAQVIVGLVAGFVEGITFFASVLSEVADIFGGLRFDNQNLGEAARLIAQIVTFVLAANITLGLINSALTGVVGLVTLIIAPLNAIASLTTIISAVSLPITVTVAAIAASVALIAAALVVGAELFRRWLSEAIGIDLKLRTIARIVGVVLVGSIRAGFSLIKSIDSFIQRNLLASVRLIGRSISEFVLGVLEQVIEASNRFGLFDSALESVRELRAELQKGIATDAVKLGTDLQQELSDLPQIFREAQISVGEALLSNEETPGVIEGFVNGVVGGTSDIASGILEGLATAAEESISKSADSAGRLADEFDRLQPSASRAVTTLASLSRISQRIEDDIERTNDQLGLTRLSLGLDGTSENLINEAFRAQVRIRENGKQLDDELLQVQRDLAASAQQRATIEARIQSLSEGNRDAVNQTADLFKEITQAQRQVFQLEQDRIVARRQLGRATEEGLVAGTREAAENLEQIQTELAAAQQAEAGLRGRLGSLGESFEAIGLNSQEIGRLARERIQAAGEEVGLLENQNQLLRERRSLETAISTISGNRLASFGGQEATEQALENQSRLFDVVRKRLEFESEFSRPEVQRISSAQLELDIAERRLQISQSQNERDLQAIRSVQGQVQARIVDLSLAQQIAQSEEQRQALGEAISSQLSAGAQIERLIAATKDRQLIQESLLNTEVAARTRELEEQRAAVEAPLRTGFLDGLRAYVAETATLSEGIAQLTASTIQDIAAFGAQEIANIFDPTVNTSLRERIGRFLLGLGQQILQTVFATLLSELISTLLIRQTFDQATTAGQLAAASAWQSVGVTWAGISSTLLTAATLLAGTSVASGGAIGFAEGGSIGGSEAPRAPRGLHPSDRIPIWAAKDEFMIRARSAVNYGHDVMDAINRGLIDPTALRALAGVGRSRKQISSMPKLGMASGGRTAASTIQSARVETSLPRTSAPVAAYVVASEEAVERLLSGGSQAVVRFMDEQGYVRR